MSNAFLAQCLLFKAQTFEVWDPSRSHWQESFIVKIHYYTFTYWLSEANVILFHNTGLKVILLVKCVDTVVQSMYLVLNLCHAVYKSVVTYITGLSQVNFYTADGSLQVIQ